MISRLANAYGVSGGTTKPILKPRGQSPLSALGDIFGAYNSVGSAMPQQGVRDAMYSYGRDGNQDFSGVIAQAVSGMQQAQMPTMSGNRNGGRPATPINMASYRPGASVNPRFKEGNLSANDAQVVRPNLLPGQRKPMMGMSSFSGKPLNKKPIKFPKGR
jgi:hypothetical protein